MGRSGRLAARNRHSLSAIIDHLLGEGFSSERVNYFDEPANTIISKEILYSRRCRCINSVVFAHGVVTYNVPHFVLNRYQSECIVVVGVNGFALNSNRRIRIIRESSISFCHW